MRQSSDNAPAVPLLFVAVFAVIIAIGWLGGLIAFSVAVAKIVEWLFF